MTQTIASKPTPPTPPPSPPAPPSPPTTASEKPKPPNWVDIGTLITRALVGLSAVIFTAIFGLAQTDEIAETITRNRMPLPAIECDVLEPVKYIEIDDKIYDAIPIVAKVTNNGLYHVHIEEVTCSLRRATIAAVTDLQPVPELIADSHEQVQSIGFIDPAPEQWTEFDREQTRKTAWDIPPGQSRQVTFYIVATHFNADELIRAFVTIRPRNGDKWQEQTWSGFVDQNVVLCYPTASPAGQDYSPGAEDAPPGPTDADNPGS